MKILRTASLVASLAIVSCQSAYATTLTFEDLNPAPAAYDTMPGTYGGLSFTGWYFGPDTVFTPASGSIDLFTDYADPADPGAYILTSNGNAVSSGTAFYFDGATFSGYSGVTFELYLAGSLVHTSDSIADAAGPDPYAPTFLASGHSGLVDTVKVYGVQGYYAMDDFSFRAAPTTAPVPEPRTYALMALGLAAVAGIARRKKAA